MKSWTDENEEEATEMMVRVNVFWRHWKSIGIGGTGTILYDMRYFLPCLYTVRSFFIVVSLFYSFFFPIVSFILNNEILKF